MLPAQASRNSYLGHTDGDSPSILSLIHRTVTELRVGGLLNHGLLNSTHSSKMILRRWRALWDDDSS